MSSASTKTLVTRAGALITGKWVQDGLKLLLLLWLARSNVDGFGLFTFAMGVAIMMRSPLGLDQFTIRELAADRAGQGAVLSQMIRLKSVLGSLMVAGLLAFGWLKGWNATQTLVVLVVSLHQILEAVADTIFSLYRTEGLQVQEAKRSALAHILGATYGALALLLGWGIVAVALFVLLTSAIKITLGLAAGAAGGKMPALTAKGPVWPKGHVISLLAMVAISFLGSLYNHVQVFLLKQFGELSDVALYGAAMEQAGGLAGLVSAFVIGGVLYPALAHAAARGPAAMQRTTQAFFWQMAAYGLGVAFLFATFGGDLLYILYGPKYNQAVLPLRVLGLAVLFSFLNNLMNHVLLAEGRERTSLLFHTVPAAVSIGLGIVLIPPLGPIGAALNLLACRMVMSLLMVGYAHYRFQVLRWHLARPVLAGAIILAVGYPLFLLAQSHAVVPRLVALLAAGAYAFWLYRYTTRPGAGPVIKRPGARPGKTGL